MSIEGSSARAALVLAALSALAGCASIGPRPWEHDLLAKRPMQMDTHPVVTAADEHIYSSKEGSAGGHSTSSQGCGCN